jgi:hypothetical protein
VYLRHWGRQPTPNTHPHQSGDSWISGNDFLKHCWPSRPPAVRHTLDNAAQCAQRLLGITFGRQSQQQILSKLGIGCGCGDRKTGEQLCRRLMALDPLYTTLGPKRFKKGF